MSKHWLNKEVASHRSSGFLVDTLRAVEENLAALAASAQQDNVRAVAMVQEATLGFVRDKLLESWEKGVQHGTTGRQTP